MGKVLVQCYVKKNTPLIKLLKLLFPDPDSVEVYNTNGSMFFGFATTLEGNPSEVTTELKGRLGELGKYLTKASVPPEKQE